MESILVYPKNIEEYIALQDFLVASNIRFEIQSHEKLPQHVLDGIARGLEQAKNGQTISLEEFIARHLQNKSIEEGD